ncbi:MAG: hypothetical protein JXJ22_01755 [Bacteroidales bacterium]|nr:hypothetical protein [Bacteroidales bacterium]
MKKPTVLLILCFLTIGAYSQVFNTSSTLGKGNFSAGFEPVIYINGGNDLGLFLHGGAGLTSNVDLGVKLGIFGGSTYVGGDLEFEVGKNFSISAGAHAFNDLAIDGTALFTLPLAGNVSLYTGADMDIIFANEILIPVWIPVGLEVGIKNKVSFILESQIKITNVGYHVLGGGLNFYF